MAMCKYNTAYIEGDTYYATNESQPSILCGACALYCYYKIKVHQVSLPDNVDNIQCQCGRRELYCYFFPDKGNSNDPHLYNFTRGIEYSHTAEDKKKVTQFRIENPHRLLASAAFHREKKDYLLAIRDLGFVMHYNPNLLSTIVSEKALDLSLLLGCMTDAQEELLQHIKGSKKHTLLFFRAALYCLRLAVMVLEDAKDKVEGEAKENLTIVDEHFKHTFSKVIKDALGKHAASFDRMPIFSLSDYRFYCEHVDPLRKTKAKLLIGDIIHQNYDWMTLVEEAGRDGFKVYLCSEFEEQLSDAPDEIKKVLTQYLARAQ